MAHYDVTSYIPTTNATAVWLEQSYSDNYLSYISWSCFKSRQTAILIKISEPSNICQHIENIAYDLYLHSSLRECIHL